MSLRDEQGRVTGDTAHLIEEATRLYDEEKYSAGRDLFIEAAMLAPPTELVMTLLADTFKRDKRQVLRNLAYTYPESMSVKKGVAESLVNDTFSNFAVRLCTELLDGGGLSSKEELEITWTRFRATANSRLYDDAEFYMTLIPDFIRLWKNLEEGNTFGLRFQPSSLLEVFARIYHPPVALVLQRLRNQITLPSSVVEFLEAKIEELEMLGKIKREDAKST